jgi:hypothetical protein
VGRLGVRESEAVGLDPGKELLHHRCCPLVWWGRGELDSSSDHWDADRVAVFCVFGGRLFSPTGVQQFGFGGDYWVVPEDDPWRVTPSPH